MSFFPIKKEKPYPNYTFKGTNEEFLKALEETNTIWVGNMSVFTTEEQIFELFSRCGSIKEIIIVKKLIIKKGLNKTSFNPAGFCFVM
jgi:nuclear cap-binding protein subunit 2